MVQARLAQRPRGEEQTRERLLTTAAELFADQGYAGTSIRDIAREVGVTVGAIYVHFPSKERLLVAVYEEGVGQIGRAVDAAYAHFRSSGQGGPRPPAGRSCKLVLLCTLCCRAGR